MVSSRAPDAAAPTLEPGSRVGSYELIRNIGKGGMGVVFLARDLTLGRRVAIKFLAADTHEILARRFVVEARTTARCVHENIVVIHEVSAWQGMPYMVLEYLEGETLGAILRRGPLAASRAMDLLLPVARAMVCAHEASITHRDLKPENILVTRHGVVKVLDFGIAKLGHRESRDELLRRDAATLEQLDAGKILGSGPYMSPEQWSGGTIDGRTDIYAFGVIAYRALTGAHPVGSLDLDQIRAACADPQPFRSLAEVAPQLRPELVHIIDRCLQKRPEYRFSRASELVRALEGIGAHAHDLRDDECPYPGLVGFGEADSDRYFGRPNQIRRALELVRQQPVSAIVGHSGSGKSSFVIAGLVPALRGAGQGWEIVVARPGVRPLQALVLALRDLLGAALPASAEEVLAVEPGRLGEWLRSWCRDHARQVLIVIDQFEEVFALSSTLPQREAFVTALLGAVDDEAGPVRAVLTMRSDFLQAVAAHPNLADAVVAGTLLLTPLDRSSLQAALQGPLQQRGYQFEDREMVDEVVSAFDGDIHALPILQAVATQLWSHRDRSTRTIPRAAISAIGGVAGALARHANGVLAALPSQHRPVARTILLRLVTAQGTRVAADRADLERLDPAAPFVVSSLIASRLVIAHEDAATIELVHEVLVTGWPQLAAWLAGSRDEHATRERISNAAAAWDAQGRAKGLLWSGDAVVEAKRMVASEALTSTERAFVEATIRADNIARRRRRALIATALIVALLVAGASMFALAMVRRAEQAATAEATRATSEAARSSSAEQALAEKVRALEQAQREREAQARLAAGQAREIDAQQKLVERGEAALRRALEASEALARKLQQALTAEQASHAELERSLSRERASLARERARVLELERNRAKIINKLPE